MNAKATLPPGWRWVALGNACEINMGQSPEGTSYNIERRGEPLLNGPTEFGSVHPTAVQWTTAPTRFCQTGDILLCVRGATTGRKNIADQRYCIGRGLAAVRGRDGVAETSFLWFILDVVTETMLKQTAGSTFPNLPGDKLDGIPVPLPPISEQRRIAAHLRDQMAQADRARAALQTQSETLDTLIQATLRESLSNGNAKPARLAECLTEITEGIGEGWRNYPVLGATRSGLAPAKEGVGKNPGRYKPVRPGTIFYNPMRILLGSIAMLEEEDAPGMTSPDYVVMTAVEGRLSARWFYHWFRSRYGAEFIKSMTRGAVRERLLFKRLAPATLLVPDWKHQQAAAAQFVTIRQTKAKLAERLAALEHLPGALLREAFHGRT